MTAIATGFSRVDCGVSLARKTGRATLLGALALALPVFFGCGGGSGSGPGSGGLAFRALWEKPSVPRGIPCGEPGPTPVPSGFGTEIPASVSLIQIEVSAADGTGCCIRLDKDQQRRSVALADVPEGDAMVTITGFPDRDSATLLSMPECRLDPSAPNPPSHPCSEGREGQPNPSFRSDSHPVSIRSAGSTNAGDIQIYSLPFVVLGDCSSSDRFMAPPLDGVATSTSIDLVVVDARGEIDGGTVDATVSQGGPLVTGVQSFRCSDDFAQDREECSCGGAFGVSGYKTQGSAASLEPGGALVTIAATSCDGRSLNFEYPFTYAPLPTPTETPLPTDTPTPSPTPTIPVVLTIVGDQVAPGNLGTVSVTMDVPPNTVVAQVLQRVGFALPVVLFNCMASEPLQGRAECELEPIGCQDDCQDLRVEIPRLENDIIPPGTLCICDVTVLETADPGIFPLSCGDTLVQDFEDRELSAVCIPGQVEPP